MPDEISCEIYYNGNSYPIMIWEQDVTIPLENYGMNPGYIGPDCKYICSFEITDGLYVNQLKFHERDNHYCPINGVPPHIMTKELQLCLSKSTVKYAYYFGVNMKLPYSGKLLLGKSAPAHPLIPGGDEWPWSAQRLYELEFKDGSLVNTVDYSDLAHKMREAIKQRKPLSDSEKWDELFQSDEKELSDSLFLALDPLCLPLWWLHIGSFEKEHEQKVREMHRSQCQKRQEEKKKRMEKLFEKYDFLIDL